VVTGRKQLDRDAVPADRKVVDLSVRAIGQAVVRSSETRQDQGLSRRLEIHRRPAAAVHGSRHDEIAAAPSAAVRRSAGCRVWISAKVSLGRSSSGPSKAVWCFDRRLVGLCTHLEATS
jgi:hypothetical protein